MGTLSLVSKYLKDLEECMDDGDLRVAKEVKLFDVLEKKSVVIEVDNQKTTIFNKAPLWAFGEPFMRYFLPCKVDGQRAWDVELDLVDSAHYVTEKVFENMGFTHVSLSDYGRKMVNDVIVETHGVKFKADFVVLDYVNEEEHSIVFGRDFSVTTKSQVDFGLGEIRMNLTMFKLGIDVIDLLEEVGSSSEEVVKMGKANRNKGYNINKLTPPPYLRLEEIPPISTIPPQSTYHPLTVKQKEKRKEVLDIKYKELEELKIILKVLENYFIYKRKLDEILIGKERLNKKEFSKEDKINGFVKMVALVDTGASIICKLRRWEKTCGAIIDMGRGTLCIDDGVVHHTYFPKPQSKSYVEAFEMEGEDDWLGIFEVGRDEDGNVKYGPVAPSFIDIEDDMERPLAMEAYFNPFKNEHNNLLIATVSNANLKWKDLPSMERRAYCKKLSKLHEMSFRVLRVSNWDLFEGYGFEDTLREMMKLEYIYKEDGDVFVDYSWERALLIDNDIYPKWVLEFFSTLYFDKDVDRNNLIVRGKASFIRSIFCRLEVDDKQFDYKDYWTKVDDEIKKCSELSDCEYWTSNMLADELYVENTCLKKETEMPTQAEEGSKEPRGSYGLGGDDYVTSAMPDFGDSSSGYAVRGSSREARFNDDDDDDMDE
uniref:Uncharacterized protein n=1 Tax=Tanacetum cinerariifolium TaxID=118510 RepID=A0A6L2KCT4_TANCI|nr:hypothetical protein [Tanacetum cinerariifolium]